MKIGPLKLSITWGHKPSLEKRNIINDVSHVRYLAIVYIGDTTHGAEHIFRQWVEIFDASNIPYFTLFRSKKMFDAAALARPEAAIAFAKGASDVSEIVSKFSSVKAAFYTGNPGNLSQMMPFHHLRHIFIGHGDSDKATSASRMFRLYNEVWVAGQAHADRLENILPHDVTIRIVGRPQVVSSISTRLHSEVGSPAFAYLPTWEGPRADNNYSSVAMINDIIAAVKSLNGSIHVKFHPSTGARNIADRKIENRLSKLRIFDSKVALEDRHFSAAEIMNKCDYCITDVSSIVSDWVVRDKPIFVFKPKNIEVSKSSYSIDKYSYMYSSKEELVAEMTRVIRDGDDYKKEARKNALNYLVSTDATRSQAFLKQIRSVCGEDTGVE